MYRYDRFIFSKLNIYVCIMDLVYEAFIHTRSVIAQKPRGTVSPFILLVKLYVVCWFTQQTNNTAITVSCLKQFNLA